MHLQTSLPGEAYSEDGHTVRSRLKTTEYNSHSVNLSTSLIDSLLICYMILLEVMFTYNMFTVSCFRESPVIGGSATAPRQFNIFSFIYFWFLPTFS